MGIGSPEIKHFPVLRDEILELIAPGLSGTVIDCTLGFGGHSLAILEGFPECRILALDQDEQAIELAKPRFLVFEDRIEFVHANFSEIKNVVKREGTLHPTAVIADLGVSSMQLDSETRGFSFRYDAPLDMRMDSTGDMHTAAELLESMSEFEIADVIYRYGEERHSRKIARRIVAEREAGRPIRTTKQLAELVERSIPRNRKDSIHPATKTFQALRIMVNSELEILDGFLKDSVDLLDTHGILAVITFHSLEDRIVKNVFQRFAGKCICPPRIPKCVCEAKKIAEILTKKPIIPGENEIRQNPRSRSAKLRAVKKLAN